MFSSGLSIGSVGGKSDNTVSSITFSDSTVTDSENGCRIKSNANTPGTIENIVYHNIILSGITDYGIDVQQDYLNMEQRVTQQMVLKSRA
jgi:polygalacturonase